ncbi:hypothetical protein SprV_0702320600 [Sparganum proliferum]
MQLRWSGHLVRMDDERLPKRIFYGDVATGSRRQGGKIRPYKDTLKSSLKHLQINPTNWEVRIGLVGHLRINCASRTAPTIFHPPASSSSSLPPTNSNRSPEPPLPSSSSFSTTTPPTAAQAAVPHITNPGTTTDTTPTASDSSDEDQDYTCPNCDRTFISRIGLVGHFRIHRTATGAPVPGAPTYTHRARLHCPQCPRTFTHRMGLFGHMRIHESGIDRSTDSTIMPNPAPTSPPRPPTALPATDTDTTVFTCPQCPRTFTSRIGLVGHLRIHRTETGELVPGAPTYTHHARLKCHTVLARSGIAWAYSATCASATTCGRQPPARSHHHTLPP